MGRVVVHLAEHDDLCRRQARQVLGADLAGRRREGRGRREGEPEDQVSS
ncbi:MAG: hypothetical protein N2Z62_04525 [Rhodobacteraceae bacterium]|nr:hypothetical protein [Paracoccaceae bacterium]